MILLDQIFSDRSPMDTQLITFEQEAFLQGEIKKFMVKLVSKIITNLIGFGKIYIIRV